MTERDALVILRGEDPVAAARAASTLWEMWHRSGDRHLDAILAGGIAAMERQDLAGAEAAFTSLIEAAPDFAEGWNKRATVRYMAQDFEGAIADCRETLARKPSHFGALSGQGLCHVALEQWQEAATMFRRTLEVYPTLASARANLQTATAAVVRWN
jgi:tetratricopeptide (TPR) repeat protein